MKLQHIRQSLNDIKSDDLMDIEELKEKINDLEHLLNKKYNELDKIEKRKEIINNILNIRENKKLVFRILRPFIDLFIMSIGGVLIAISMETIPISLIIFFLLIIGLSADALSIIQKEYSKLTEREDSIDQKIIKTIFSLINNKESFTNEMSECLSVEKTVNNEINQMEQEISLERNKRDNLEEEIDFIDGSIYAVNFLIEKYKIDDMNDKTDLVQFIQDKKKLRKVIEAYNAY